MFFLSRVVIILVITDRKRYNYQYLLAMSLFLLVASGHSLRFVCWVGDLEDLKGKIVSTKIYLVGRFQMGRWATVPKLGLGLSELKRETKTTTQRIR